MIDHLRSVFLNALEQAQLYPAIQAARALLAEDAGLRQWSFIHKAVAKYPAEHLDLKPLRVALLSSFSIEFIHDSLLAQGFLNSLHLSIYQSGFAQYRQEILTPASGLYAFQPDVVVLAVEGKDLLPAFYEGYLDEFQKDCALTLEQTTAEWRELIKRFRQNSAAVLLLHNCVAPTVPPLGILDGHLSNGQEQLIHQWNSNLYTLAGANRNIYVVDYARLVRRWGSQQWYDNRMEYYARLPVAQGMLPHLAAEYLKFFRAITGKTKKCLVLDLDNTLWGGVIGEDGLQGIRLGPDYPGNAFVAFQKVILDLYKRGVILAIASKNNLTDVLEVFEKHPYRVLEQKHFAHMEIGWNPKSQSLEAIANRLNIGLEHIVFADDNPAECEQVRQALPMVTVIQLPKQPERCSAVLLEEGLFDGLHYSAEDLKRNEFYQQRAQAEEFRAQSTSLEDFYRNLEMELIIAPVTAKSLPRAAQLTQKTNQFNLTTFRYTEAEIGKRLADPSWLLSTVQVRDRFGDHGIVGVILAQQEGDQLKVDTFLLSCRVIGRTIETAMLAFLCEEGRRRGSREIIGWVIPTKKNAPARDLYQQHGFDLVGTDANEASYWRLRLDARSLLYPPWFKIVTPDANA